MCTSVGISASQLSWLSRRSSCCCDRRQFASSAWRRNQTRLTGGGSSLLSTSLTSGKQAWEEFLFLRLPAVRNFQQLGRGFDSVYGHDVGRLPAANWQCSSSSSSSSVGGMFATRVARVSRVMRLAASRAAGEMDAGSESDSSTVEGNGTAELNTVSREKTTGVEEEEGDWSSRAAAQRRVKKDVASMREKMASFAEKQSKYFWLGGPIVITTAIVLPPAMISLVAQLQKNFLLGLATAFGFDVLFILAADAFFVLTDKTGHHQRVSTEGPPPWIGPWEYTGYPEGEPALSKAVSFAGVAIAAATLLLSFLVGKLGIALPALGPYLALIFAQVAYERLMSNDRLPVYPLVPIVYTVYRFRQLARGMELVVAMGGDWFLTAMMRVLMVVWTFFLAAHLTQLPWLYSTWNSNRAT